MRNSDDNNADNHADSTASLAADAHKMNLYSRQIGEYGMEAMGKLIKMRVLVCGMRGLGVEVAKNLVLAGPGAVHVFDPELPRECDAGLNFFLPSLSSTTGTETRAQISARELQKLNRLVEVRSVDLPELTEAVVAGFSCIVVTNKMSPSEADKWNQFARQRGIGFIAADVFGPSGFAFVDFGDQFAVRDVNGEQPLSRLVSELSGGSAPGRTLVRIVDDGRRHNLDESEHDGYVQFEDLASEPLRQLMQQPGQSFRIHHAKHPQTNKFDAFAFEIDLDLPADVLAQAQSSGGRWTQVKRPVQVSFQSYQQSKAQPCEGSFLFTDGAKLFRAEQLHLAFQQVWAFQQANNRLPSSDADVDECLRAVQEQKNQDAFDEQVCRHVFRFAHLEFQPLSAFFGGVVAQEVVKLTGKYSPLRQWLHVDAFEVLPATTSSSFPLLNVTHREGDLRALLGDQVCDKVEQIHAFQVGCGALGCEFLKNFAMLGAAKKSKGGLVTVTDNDRIEVSNLSRQFLFREENVGQSKSLAATAAAQRMNGELSVNALELLVAPNTESTFSNAFFAQQTFVLNALDNVQARNYVDARCVFNEKALLESGTLGTKCNVQVILPFLTQSYTDGPKDAQSADIPMCTLRNFPSEIEHCIEWARARFTDGFSVAASQANAFQTSPDEFLNKLKQSTAASELASLRDVVRLVRLVRGGGGGGEGEGGNTLQRCVHDALDLFHERFFASVQQLIASYPEDAVDSNGKRFWQGTKRFPQPIAFDPNNELHMTFVLTTANLLAFNRGLERIGDELPLDSANRQPQFVLDKMQGWEAPKKAEAAAAEKKEDDDDDEDEEEYARLQAELAELAASATSASTAQCEPCEFEKDSDLNFHIDFVYACSNLRALNYRIKPATRHQVKMIAGKIIPALATTTASVCGLVMIEMLKLVQGDKPLEAYKDSSNSLGVNGYFFSEPLQPNKAKNEYDPIEMCEVVCQPPGFSKWDKIKLETSSQVTLREFIHQFNTSQAAQHGHFQLTTLAHPSANVSTSSGFGKFIYESAPWDPKTKHEYDARQDRQLAQVVDEIYGAGTVSEVTMLETAQVSLKEGEDDAPVKVPTVVWIVNQ